MCLAHRFIFPATSKADDQHIERNREGARQQAHPPSVAKVTRGEPRPFAGPRLAPGQRKLCGPNRGPAPAQSYGDHQGNVHSPVTIPFCAVAGQKDILLQSSWFLQKNLDHVC